MIKVLAFLRFLPEFAGEAGRKRYEEGHAPLAYRLLPMMSAYRRNYRVQPESAEGTAVHFDVITEMCFADEAAYAEFQEVLKGEAGMAIAADSGEFMDRSATVSWVSEEVASPAR